jgi:hypothetical protein
MLTHGSNFKLFKLIFLYVAKISGCWAGGAGEERGKQHTQRRHTTTRSRSSVARASSKNNNKQMHGRPGTQPPELKNFHRH